MTICRVLIVSENYANVSAFVRCQFVNYRSTKHAYFGRGRDDVVLKNTRFLLHQFEALRTDYVYFALLLLFCVCICMTLLCFFFLCILEYFFFFFNLQQNLTIQSLLYISKNSKINGFPFLPYHCKLSFKRRGKLLAPCFYCTTNIDISFIWLSKLVSAELDYAEDLFT